MIKRILLAVDLGVYTPYLLQHAASLSKQYQASIVVVHAVQPLGSLGHALLQTYLKPETRKVLTTTGMDGVVEQIRTKVIDILTDEYMSGDMELPRVEGVVVKPGEPEEVIFDTAAEKQVDMIILGSCSSDPSGSHLGAVSQKILGASKWPVYLVPYPYPVWLQSSGRNDERRL